MTDPPTFSRHGRPRWPRVSLVPALLQVSHRSGVIALLCLLGTLVAAWTRHEFYPVLAITAGCAWVGASAALLTLSRSPRLGLAWVIGIGGCMAPIWYRAAPGTTWPVCVATAVTVVILLAVTPESNPASSRREAIGVLVFNGVLAVVAVMLMIVARLGVLEDDLRAGGSDLRVQVQEWTAPLPPPTP